MSKGHAKGYLEGYMEGFRNGYLKGCTNEATSFPTVDNAGIVHSPEALDMWIPLTHHIANKLGEKARVCLVKAVGGLSIEFVGRDERIVIPYAYLPVIVERYQDEEEVHPSISVSLFLVSTSFLLWRWSKSAILSSNQVI